MQIFWKIIFFPFKLCWYLLSFTRELISNLILIICILGIIGIYFKICKPFSDSKKGALIVDITGSIIDEPTKENMISKFSNLLINNSKNQLQENSLFNIINKLRKAKNDDNITGLVLFLENITEVDQTSLNYIGKVLKEFKSSGKPIYSIGNSYSQSQYFLASYSDKIYLMDQGAIDLHGISKNNFYYKSLLDKLKINSHIFRVGTYKSAVEPFIRDNMSDEARKSESRWINKLWKNYLTTISNNRKIKLNNFFINSKEFVNEMYKSNGDLAKFALNNKLVDEIYSSSKFDSILINIFGKNNSDKIFNGISIYDYNPKPSKEEGSKIAVIFINGVIIDSLGTSTSANSISIANQIKDARLNPDIKSVIFRINSPGGGVTASEVIRSEINYLRKSGKPIVISMGEIAASGGYWISTSSDYIIADSDTLTGSIGVFGIINTIDKSLESIGIHTDGVSTSSLAGISITKKLPIEFSQIMQLNVKNKYNTFIELVAKSRNKTLEEVDKISQGRIWIGSDALKNGLIDKLGDFDDAVKKASELAKLKKYHLYWYPIEHNFFNLLFSQVNSLIFNYIPDFAKIYFSEIISRKTEQINLNSNTESIWDYSKNCYAICLSCNKK